MTITEQVAKNIIKKLLKGEDYRIEVVTLINAEFLQFAIDFFKHIVDAKLKSKDITVDWYKKAFLNPNLPAKEIAINSGLNKKIVRRVGAGNTRNEYQSVALFVQNESQRWPPVPIELKKDESIS